MAEDWIVMSDDEREELDSLNAEVSTTENYVSHDEDWDWSEFIDSKCYADGTRIDDTIVPKDQIEFLREKGIELDFEGEFEIDPNADNEEALINYLNLDSRINNELNVANGKLLRTWEDNKAMRRRNKELSAELTVVMSKLKQLENLVDNPRTESERGPYFLSGLADITTEKIMIGLYMNNPKLMNDFNQAYLDVMFYDERYRMIHETMMGMKTDIIDNVTLKRALIKKDFLERIGGEIGLMDCQSAAETMGKEENIHSYIRVLEEMFLKRALFNFSQKTLTDCCDDSKLDGGFVEYIRQRSIDILDVLPFRFKKTFDRRTLVDASENSFNELLQRGGKPHISTGYKGLDRMVHGILPKKLILNGARAKVGKTTFAVNLMKNVVEQGHHSLIYNYENSFLEVINMIIAMETGIAYERFEYFENKFTKAELNKIEKAREYVKANPFLFEGGSPEIGYVINRTKQLKNQYPDLALVVIDGLQAFGTHVPKYTTKADHLYKILTILKTEIASELDITVLVNAQLKRDVEKRKSRKPLSLDDFADCKGAEDLCDAAIALYRPESYWPDEKKYQGWTAVVPIALRVGDKKGREFKLYGNASGKLSQEKS